MCHALIIEDEFIIAEHLMMVAEDAGATSCACATTEGEALHEARRKRPTIILSDVRLAIGNGPLAVQAIIAEYGPIPVIFITGNPEECKVGAPPGIVMSKPVNTRLLIAAFQELLPSC